MKLLVGDIGGTNARFGFQEKKGADIENVEFLICADFDNIDHAVNYYISKNNLSVENLSLSVAGPCGDNFIKFTNNHWSFDKNDLLIKTNCNSILAINDFAAQGLGFTSLFKNKSSSQYGEVYTKSPCKIKIHCRDKKNSSRKKLTIQRVGRF